MKGKFKIGARFPLRCGIIVTVTEDIDKMKVRVEDDKGVSKITWKTSLSVGKVSWEVPRAKDDFIGRKFGEFDQVEVIGHTGITHKGGKGYLVHCSKCCEDTELFGEGTFKVRRNLLETGGLPCGCSKKYLWSRDQYAVRLKRVCEDLGMIFVDFVNLGEVNGKSKVILRCSECETVWDTSSVGNTLNCGVGCPKCRVDAHIERRTVPDDVAIQKFRSTGSFIEGTAFTRNGKTKDNASMWDVICPICSVDEYVKAGLCSGVFRTSGSSLNIGRHPCRCSSANILTEEQQRFRIQSIIDDGCLKYSIVGWEDGVYSGVGGKVVLKCPEHGEWPVGISHFVSKGSRCPSCTEFGFNRHSSKSFVYILKVVGGSGDFTGYGITGNFSNRLQEHKRNLIREGFEVISTSIFKVDGESAMAIESSVKKEFPLTSKDVSGFIREATHPHLYNNVVDFVQERAKIAWSKLSQQNETHSVDSSPALAA